ncbi:maltooligosyl trehalose synthase [Nocardioides sp. Root1257]|uniref:malto-oligosyltrehalose synthase n=1 Tax=unclassified Nocardioides TaxID=2615069 RepID=UPI0006FA7EEC|nr:MULTISPECIES: malto-oligosyltrehalose synthase [unclassified Nocardioides]KQW47287.1 maltooligosyl trehalose synthase [Nocardioides sp. Root1257]KRC45443.1 maltooligosyl trehalose synthase [Nocardioides sp. Root224]
MPDASRSRESRIPASTYRLQITAELDLFQAAARLRYLHDLGVDWVYLSPLLAAEPGSSHGYDVVAFDHVDPSRGGAEGLGTLAAEARRLGMGVLVDIVPNHVGVATPAEDAWWWDVLQHGRESEHANAFDIDWAAGDGRLLIPVVGDGDEDAIVVRSTAEGGELWYHDLRFPLTPGTTTHDEQHYQLVNWHEADDNLNYRRFFAVNSLAAVRVEDPEVFAESHVEIRRWFEDGLVDGLRVDHPDGLRDPKRYLEDLAQLTGGAYVLVEKILEPGESLPADWATQGTTGYDALGLVDRVLTDPAGQAPLDALETRLRGGPVDWAAMIHGTKREVADGILHSEVRRITREIRRLTSTPFTQVEDAVAELLACFPVYRSYLPEGLHHLEQAFELAREHRPDLAATYDALLPILVDGWTAPARRFQQTSGMVMAKGVEDCAFYRFSRLTSLNEVGGDPSVFSVSVDEFHAAMATRQAEWPHAMTTLSTHDTKRGEDVRARITALAELPEVWTAALDELLELAPVPDPGFGSLLWQAILGAWPTSPDPDLRSRLHGYAEKAMREAGDRTTWTEPNETYEAAVHAAVDAAFDSPDVRRVLDGLLAQVAWPGRSNALAAKLVALTMPGVPDVYQGSELWEQSLVDPDNRRFVDFDHRAHVLAGTAEDDAAAKLHLTRAALTLRRDRPDLFTTYAPAIATGPEAKHVLAFDRGGALTVATRLPVGLAATGWGATRLTLPPGSWTDVLTGRPASSVVADLLDVQPVALLVKENA